MKTVKYRDYCEALRVLQDQFEEEGIHIQDLGYRFRGEPIRLGVNWSSVGAVSSKDAVNFANRLLDASMAAENFAYNGYTIRYGD